MRAALLMALMSVLSVAGVFVPQLGLYAYVWYSLMRPDVLAYVYGQYPYAMAAAVPTLLGSIRFLPGISCWWTDLTARTLILLQIPVLLSGITAIEPELCIDEIRIFESVVLMALMIPLLIRTLPQLRNMLLIVAGSLGFLGFKFGAWGVFHGGVRYQQGMGGFLEDNNGLALAMSMAVPLCWYARSAVESKWLKFAYLVMSLGCAATVIQTFARGGALSLGIVILLIAGRAGRKILTFALLAAMIVPVVILVEKPYLARLQTLRNPDLEASAANRLEQYAVALKVGKDYPLLGVGFGGDNYIRVASRYLGHENRFVVHNTYLQILADSGIFALLLYLGLLFGTIFRLGRSIKRMKLTRPDLAGFPLALQTSLIAFAVGSTFYSRIKFEPYYIVLMCASAWLLFERHLQSEPQETVLAEDALVPVV